MNKAFSLLILLLLGFAFDSSADTLKDKVDAYRMDVEFRGKPASEALQRVGELSGVDVYYNVPQAEDTKITLSLKQMPASEVFSYIAAAAGLDVLYKDDGVYFSQKE